jgi:hypothetical protein
MMRGIATTISIGIVKIIAQGVNHMQGGSFRLSLHEEQSSVDGAVSMH